MAKSFVITVFFLAFGGQLNSAYNLDESIPMQSTSLLQVTSFLNDGDDAQPQEPWGLDEEEADLEDGSEDVDSEGVSELQLSSERVGQPPIQSPGSSPNTVQYLSQGPVLPQTPQQGFSAAVPPPAAQPPVTGLVSTSAAVDNASGAAFSQLSALEAEFKELREDDASHVKQLMYTVHLREQLREQLAAAQKQLEQDNEQLAERTSELMNPGKQGAAASTSPRGEPESATGQLEQATNTTVAAMLLQAAISSRQHRELNNQQIATEALDRVQSLMKDIAALKNRDEAEMQALRANADSRNALRTKIDKRSTQLQQDANALIVDLGQIRGLVHPDDGSGNQAAQPSDAQGTNPGEQSIALPQEAITMLQQSRR